MLDARKLYAAGAALAALLAVPAFLLDPPDIKPSEAGRFEGSRVQMEGIATDGKPFGSGFRFDLVRDGHRLAIQAPIAPPRGSWVHLEGTLMRSGGALVLWADDATVGAGPEPEPVALAVLATRPEAYAGKVLRLAGWIEDGRLDDHTGHSIAVSGDVASDGIIDVVGSILPDASCLCERLVVQRAWTS